jgi:hypothetical protein
MKKREKRDAQTTGRAALHGLVLVALAFVFCGCVSSGQSNYKNSLMNFGAIQSVAVLPLQNLSNDDDAPERVRDTFMVMLLATEAIYVLPPGEVDRGLERLNIRNPAKPTSEQVQKLGQILGVEAVIAGTLREYGPARSGQTQANMISLSLQMLEVETGSIVWSASSTRGGIGFSDRLFGGGGEPMNEVTRSAIDDLLDELFK